MTSQTAFHCARVIKADNLVLRGLPATNTGRQRLVFPHAVIPIRIGHLFLLSTQCAVNESDNSFFFSFIALVIEKKKKLNA